MNDEDDFFFMFEFHANFVKDSDNVEFVINLDLT